jgi:hypothetical protein
MPDLVREAPAARPSDEAWLGSVLIATWALRTGRVLRYDVPVGSLAPDELISFWADPLLDDTPPPSSRWYGCQVCPSVAGW